MSVDDIQAGIDAAQAEREEAIRSIPAAQRDLAAGGAVNVVEKLRERIQRRDDLLAGLVQLRAELEHRALVDSINAWDRTREEINTMITACDERERLISPPLVFDQLGTKAERTQINDERREQMGLRREGDTASAAAQKRILELEAEFPFLETAVPA